MEVRILHLAEGARAARGLTVVIDVFRAFSLVPYAFAAGVSRVVPVATEAEARALGDAHPDWLLAGEKDGKPFDGFDFGNAPSEIAGRDLTGRVLVHRTSAGTQGLVAARDADTLLTGSFVNAAAIVRYIRAEAPDVVSLVCMGWSSEERTVDDIACAEYLAAGLAGDFPDFAPVRERIRAEDCGAKFFDPTRPWFPEADFDLCLSPSRFDFVALAERGDDGLSLRRVDV